MKKYALIFGWALIMMPSSLYAQNEAFNLDLPDEVILKVIGAVRPMVHRLKISDTEFVGPETPEQLADPLLTNEEVEVAVVRGIISVTAEWCGFDWENKSFVPFMKQHRANGKLPKQMAYIGALHGYGMNIMKTVHENKQCPDSMKKRVKGALY